MGTKWEAGGRKRQSKTEKGTKTLGIKSPSSSKTELPREGAKIHQLVKETLGVDSRCGPGTGQAPWLLILTLFLSHLPTQCPSSGFHQGPFPGQNV